MQDNVKNNIEDIYELSPMQQGMLFHTLYKEGSDEYIEQFCYDLKGVLNDTFFRIAWEEALKRHDVLRTSFQWKGISKPVQVVNRNADLPWEYLDWSNLDHINQKEEFNKFLSEDRKNTFSLEKAPLMRCTLIKHTEEYHRFIWTFHHVIMDGWSYPILQKEVFTLYEAQKNNKVIDLPKPISYKEYILWLNKQDRNSAKQFWTKELDGISSPTPMITDSSNNTDKQISEVELNLTSELTETLLTFAKQNQVTLNTIIQGAWSIILSTYRSEQQVLFGGTVSGRTPLINGIETMVGLFINTLPVKANVDPDKNIVTWLKELQINQIERDQFSYSSLVDIQEYSSIPRGSQLFENILVFENYPLDKSFEEGIAGLKVTNLRAYERTNFSLTIIVSPGKFLTLRIAYDLSKFKENFINQILSNFNILLSNISKGSDKKISDFSLLSEHENHTILAEWNDTYKKFPADKSVHELFEEVAGKNPDAVAVEFSNEKITYSDLNNKANQLANYLQKLGIGPDVIVGLCIERSPEMIIALLGILKAGGAYLPLDSSYPSERLAFMIEDSDINVLITTSVLLEKLPQVKSKVVLIDDEADIIAGENKNLKERKGNPSNLAYIIYTSGSTGKPKGVLMKHEALTNLLYWQVYGQKFAKGYRTLQFTTLSFDVSFQEIFSTWYSEGTLVLLKKEERQDLSWVLKIIDEKKIQRIFLPFIALQELAELFQYSDFKLKELREVYTAGEQLQTTPAVVNLFKCLKNYIFANHYGPSEAHVVTSFALSNNPDDWAKLPPIGKPIYNIQMYILNSSLKPVPIGVTADLYIGGIGLVKGYHNRPELTQEKFIDNPYSNNEHDFTGKLYKTGDIARYLSDGNIEFLGRSDNQIKLRGFRIELGEIESIISEYPGIKKIAVAAKEYSGDKRLVGYFVSNGKSILRPSELTSYLKTKLPDYMIPSDFIELKEIPLTPSGKTDLMALPDPEFIRSNEKNNYIEPKDELELQLVKIWEKVLGIKPIGVNDNFFELGGHSLLALRVFGYTEKLTKKKLAISTLFESPTIRELAVILRDDGWVRPWKSLVAVKPGGSKLPFYCIPPGAGTALNFQSLVKYIPNDQPFYVLESLGLDGKEPPHTKVEEMAEHYIKEIRILQPEGPYLLGGRCFGGRVAFEMAQQFEKLNQKVLLLAIFDTWPPFSAPPPVYAPENRNLKHFISRSHHHLRAGELGKVARKYSSNKFNKAKWKVKNKIEYIFSSSKKRLYKQIMLLHFKAQDNYIAKQYPGKITLIESGTYKSEYRDGWKNLALGGFESHVVPNTNHKTIVKEPKLKFFAETLNLILEKAHKEFERNALRNRAENSSHPKNTFQKTTAG